PGLTRERRAQRADRLRRHNGDAPGLPRQRKELLVARRVVFANGGEGVVLVAEKKHLPPETGRGGFEGWGSVPYGTLKRQFHERADCASQTRIGRDGEIERADLALFDQIRKGRKHTAEAAVGIFDWVVDLFRWTEDALDGWIVVEEREED